MIYEYGCFNHYIYGSGKFLQTGGIRFSYQVMIINGNLFQAKSECKVDFEK